MRPLLVALLLAAMALSGCTGAVDDDDNGTGAATSDDPGRYVPWTLSDHWDFDMDVRGFERFTATRLAYYEESGPEYVVGTPDRAEAVYHAVFSFNPILGRIHQGHLSPHERGDHAIMFPWKDAGDVIRDGQTWNTHFYGHGLTMMATASDSVPAPGGEKPGFVIEGVDPDEPFTVTYGYVPEHKWFTYLTVTDAAGPYFSLRLTESGTGYSGPAYFIRAKDLYQGGKTSAEGIAVPLRDTFEVTQKDVDDDRVEGFAISAAIDARLGSAEIRILDPSGAQVYRKTFEDVRTSGETQIDEIFPEGKPSTKPLGQRPNWPAGTYTIEYRFAGEADAALIVVGTQDNSGRV